MEYVRGRYSWLLRPILIVFDVIVINLLGYLFLELNSEKLYFFKIEVLNNQNLLYFIYSTIFWLFSTSIFKFYNVYRYTSFLDVLILLVKQFIAFLIVVYAFIGVFRSVNLIAFQTFNYLLCCFTAIAFVKILSYYLLRLYRSKLKGNTRNVIVIGGGDITKELIDTFLKDKSLGYNIVGTYSNKSLLGSSEKLEDSFALLKNPNNIDEIYCAIDELKESEVNELVKYANINHCNIKFVPKTKKLFTKRLNTNYYGYLPVLSIEEATLNKDLNRFLKRGFDIVFSTIIIVCVLSWLSIILYILIKIESKGALFYKHKRNGINYKEFECYKYRTLKIDTNIKGEYVKKEDVRVTRVGRFLRRTSLDELPQFINIFLGDMSVVGPRPHMLSYTKAYSKVIDKYNFIYRHSVKPGLTGLAQVSGFRGEIKEDKDIINRIKYDNFYIENWSTLLDIKIIFQTLGNIIKGEEKAY